MNHLRASGTILRTCLLMALFLAGVPGLCRAQDSCPQETTVWIETKGDHFIIYSPGTDATERVREVMRRAEKYYRSIAERLMFARHDEFWLWSDRVKIYLYGDRTAYLAATQEPEGSLGMADYTHRTITSFVDSPRLTTSVLPHEIAHLILRDFFKKERRSAVPPYWLDEGVAQWSEDQETKRQIRELARGLLEDKGLLSLSDIILVNLDYIKNNPDRLYFRLIRDTRDRHNIVILSPDVLTSTFYVASGSLVGYLIETFGARRFADFCRLLSRDKPLTEALLVAYTKRFQTLQDLEEGWRTYLLEK
jgi:hypothetical protein